MQQYRVLHPGDTIGVCAPSSSFDVEKLNRGIDVIKKLGFKVNVPDTIFESRRYLAGEDLNRAMVINQLISDPDVKAIICARGGFGSMRMLEYIDWSALYSHPKPFIGFSDATALLLNVLERGNTCVIHGPNLTCLADARPRTIDSLVQALTGFSQQVTILNTNTIFSGRCNGILKGGNIATISHLLGTPFQPVFNNSVLFLEDINEPAYKIDRMLSQMKMAALFEGITGVVTGSFENCKTFRDIQDILSEIFYEYDIPVVTGLESGHGKVNLSLIMGMPVQLDSELGSLIWENHK